MFVASAQASASGIPKEVITKPEAEPACVRASHCYTYNSTGTILNPLT